MRGIFEASTFIESIGVVLPDIKRWDEISRAMKWVLSIDAERYPVIDGTARLRMCPTAEFSGMPALRVFFWIEDDDNNVELLFAEPEDNRPEGG